VIFHNKTPEEALAPLKARYRNLYEFTSITKTATTVTLEDCLNAIVKAMKLEIIKTSMMPSHFGAPKITLLDFNWIVPGKMAAMASPVPVKLSTSFVGVFNSVR
jgi:hypothetical protein